MLTNQETKARSIFRFIRVTRLTKLQTAFDWINLTREEETFQ